LGIGAGFVAVLLALVAKPGGVALFVGGCPLGGLAAFVAVCARLGVLASFHLQTLHPLGFWLIGPLNSMVSRKPVRGQYLHNV
jgi:hypothetical protein